MTDMTERIKQSSLPATYAEALRGSRALREGSAGDLRLTVAVGGNCNPAFLLPGLKLALAHEHIFTQIVEMPYDNWVAAALAPEEKGSKPKAAWHCPL